MGIPCPDFLRPLLADLGAEWPDTDESGLRELAEGFRRFATQTSCGQVSVVAEVDWLLAANRGPGIDQVKLFYSGWPEVTTRWPRPGRISSPPTMVWPR